MSEINIKDAVTSGMMWLALQKYSTIGMYFVSSIILARLLTPYDYGCIGMLDIFIAVATIMIDGGFGAALLQKKRPTQEDYSTIFYWNLFISSLMYGALFLFAPVIANFYNIPLLTAVLRIQGIVLFINALKMIQSNQLKKQFRFKSMSIIVIVSSLISVIVTIVLAYLGFGVWALVVQSLLIALLPMIAFWRIAKWMPQIVFSRESFKELFSFGGFMFLTNIINTLSDNLQGLLIGRFYSPTTMGYYAKAKSTEGLVSTGISQIFDNISLQLYSEVQDDYSRLQSILKKLTITLAFLTCPLIISMVLVAKPLFIFLYSDRWVSCVPYFQILVTAGLAVCLQSVNLQAIAAIGKSKSLFSWTLVKRIINICLIVVGLLIGGVYGILWGMVIGMWLSYFINSCLVSIHIGYRIKSQIYHLLPIIIISTCSILPIVILTIFFDFAMTNPFFSVIIFLFLYLSLSCFFRIEAYSSCKDLVPFFFNKVFKHN